MQPTPCHEEKRSRNELTRAKILTTQARERNEKRKRIEKEKTDVTSHFFLSLLE
jgi:hypothetical protein